jgi:drug/metabolite transporter (DMT)-like permease
MNEYKKGIFEITLAAVLFGIIPIIVKFSNLDIYTLSFGRIFFAALSLLIFVMFFKTKLQSIRKNKLSFFLFSLFHVLIVISFFIAIKLINLAVAVLLLYAGSIYLVILSSIFLKEKIEKITIFSLIISFLGIFTIFYSSEIILNLWGYLAGFFSGLFMAITLLIGKVLSKNYDKLSMTYYQNIIALPLILPLLFFINFNLTFNDVFILILLGSVCTALAFLLLYSGIKKVKGQKIGILLLLELVTPLFLAFILFKEIPSVREIIGGILILIGFILIALIRNNKKRIKQKNNYPNF